MSPCRPAPTRPVHRRHSGPNPHENAAAAPGVVPRQLEFHQNTNIINSLQKSGVQVGSGVMRSIAAFVRAAIAWPSASQGPATAGAERTANAVKIVILRIHSLPAPRDRLPANPFSVSFYPNPA